MAIPNSFFSINFYETDKRDVETQYLIRELLILDIVKYYALDILFCGCARLQRL